MKTRNILLTVGIILIVFNLLGLVFDHSPRPSNIRGTKATTAYLVGYNSFFILGAILLIIAWFLHRSVNRKRRQKMVDSLLEDFQKNK